MTITHDNAVLINCQHIRMILRLSAFMAITSYAVRQRVFHSIECTI